ncbi:MAG: ribosomal-protein-alanine N-acetyltransferase [Arenicella sp.]
MNKEVFKKHPQLEVGDYILKAISNSDLKEVEELCTYYPPERKTSAKALIEKVEKQYEEHSGINWGIYHNNELAGTIGFYRGFDNDQGELGYVLREKFRRKSIGKICAKAVIKVAFEQMELTAIEAYTAIDNEPSKKLLASVGFKRIENPDENTAAFRIENQTH